MWSVVEKTAFAEAEVEYEDHVSDAIYVAFPCQLAVSSGPRSDLREIGWNEFAKDTRVGDRERPPRS